MRLLLDTCVISEPTKSRSNVDVVNWLDAQDPNSLWLSVITIGEIRKGIERLPDGVRKNRLEAWLADDLLLRFTDRIAVLDVGTLLVWGALTGRLERERQQMPAIDSLIAATALHGGFSLVTRNEADFRHTGVKVINPWNL